MRGLAVREWHDGLAAVGFGPWWRHSAASAAQAKEPPKPKSIWEQDTLTGDWGGARTALVERGIDITLNYTGEVLSLLSGGVNRRTRL